MLLREIKTIDTNLIISQIKDKIANYPSNSLSKRDVVESFDLGIDPKYEDVEKFLKEINTAVFDAIKKVYSKSKGKFNQKG